MGRLDSCAAFLEDGVEPLGVQGAADGDEGRGRPGERAGRLPEMAREEYEAVDARVPAEEAGVLGVDEPADPRAGKGAAQPGGHREGLDDVPERARLDDKDVAHHGRPALLAAAPRNRRLDRFR